MTGLQTSPINRTKISSPLDLLRNSDSPSNLLTIETQTQKQKHKEKHIQQQKQKHKEKHIQQQKRIHCLMVTVPN
jgi:hypothetical protein